MDSAETIDRSSDHQPENNPKKGRWKWILLFSFCFIAFTLFKLPLGQFSNLIESHINATLEKSGVSLQAEESELSILTGVAYKMKNVSVYLPQIRDTVSFDKLSVSPSFLSLLTGKLGGDAQITLGKGTLDLTIAMADQDADVRFLAKELNLSKIGPVYEKLVKLKTSAIVNGEGQISGNLNDPSSLSGEIKLDLKQIRIDKQSPKWLFGVEIPQLQISQAALRADLTKGDLKIKRLQVGKKNTNDDLSAEVTGSVKLGKRITASRLDLITKFSLSEKIRKISGLIDTFLAPAKQSDGRYGYSLKGPVFGVFPKPIK